MQVLIGVFLGCVLTVGGVARNDSLRKPYERPLVNWEQLTDRR